MSVFLAREGKNLKSALRKSLDAFDANIDWSRGVFLKPNIVFPVKERSGQITRLKLVKTLVELIREKNAKADIIMGEGTAAGSDPEENFEVSGYTKLAEELGIDLLDLDTVDRVKIKWKYGMLKLPKIVHERIYINLPILKQSSAAGISAAMKNQKGLLMPAMKKAFHRWGLHEPIANLNLVMQPKLSILDCSRFFKGGLLIAGDNTFQVDSFVCRLLGISESEYVRVARNIGVGKDVLEVHGENKELVRASARRFPSSRDYRRLFRLRLWSNPAACSMCRFRVQDLVRLRPRGLATSFKGYWKLLRLAVEGCEVVYGRKPVFRAEFGKVICIGDCTKDLAKQGGHKFVAGCPPATKEIVNAL